MKRALYILFAVLAAAGFAYSLYVAFFMAPIQGLADFERSNPLFFNQKIFYWHVPNAFMLFVSVFVCGFGSVLYLRGRKGRWDDVALAGGELAVLFGAIVLVTGSIWAKQAWGNWWVWDVRLTSSLLLWMTMLGYVLVRKYAGLGAERLAAGLAIFACVNVPLVYISVKLWNTFHPNTSVVPHLQGDQRAALWLSVLSFFFFFLVLLRARIDVARAGRRVHEAREAGLDAGLFD